MAAGPIQERNQGNIRKLINATPFYLECKTFSSFPDATIYVGGLDEKVTESLLWELFLQAGPVGMLIQWALRKELSQLLLLASCIPIFVCLLSVNVHMPRDRITQSHQNYGFVEFMGEEDADYAIKIMNMIKVYGKPIRVNKVSISSIPVVLSNNNWYSQYI